MRAQLTRLVLLVILGLTAEVSPALAVCVPELDAQSNLTVTCNTSGAETDQQGNGNNDNVNLIVQPGALIDPPGMNRGIQVRSGNTITIDGEVRARSAVQVQGSDNAIVVGGAGIVRNDAPGGTPGAIQLTSGAGLNNTITINPGGLVTGDNTNEVISISGQVTIVNSGTIQNLSPGSMTQDRFAISINGPAANITNGGTITGGFRSGVQQAAILSSSENDTWTQLTGATVNGFVDARDGTGDRLVLSGTGKTPSTPARSAPRDSGATSRSSRRQARAHGRSRGPVTRPGRSPPARWPATPRACRATCSTTPPSSSISPPTAPTAASSAAPAP